MEGRLEREKEPTTVTVWKVYICLYVYTHTEQITVTVVVEPEQVFPNPKCSELRLTLRHPNPFLVINRHSWKETMEKVSYPQPTDRHLQMSSLHRVIWIPLTPPLYNL